MFGIKDGRRKIPIHKVGEQPSGEKCSALLKVHILTGCDIMSNIGTSQLLPQSQKAILTILVLNL